MIEKNDTCELADLSHDKDVIRVKWVYKIKINFEGIQNHKARLVVKGYSQYFGINYNEIFVSIVHLNTIRVLKKSKIY